MAITKPRLAQFRVQQDADFEGKRITNMAQGVDSADAASVGQLMDVAAGLGQAAEWQESVLTIVADPLGTTWTPGDRVLVSATPTVGGAFEYNANAIAVYKEGIPGNFHWEYITPTVGTYVSVDDQADSIFFFGGSYWTQKYFEVTSAGNGLTKDGFEISLAEGAAGDGLTYTAGVLSVNVDNSSVELDGSGNLSVKAGGITETELSTSVAGNGLAGGGGTALSIALDPESNPSLSVSATGLKLTLSSTLLDTTQVVTREVASGVIDGENAIFVLANTPLLGSENVFLNGLLMSQGDDYMITGASIEFHVDQIPQVGDRLLANYIIDPEA